VAFAKLARLARTEKILVGNAKALLEHLSRMHDPAQQLPIWSDQQAFEEFLNETERHLHNYVAAAHSRVEYFRRFVRAEWPKGSPFREEYQQRVDKEFAASQLHKFVTDLRNYVLHVRLPVSTGSLSWVRDGPLTCRTLLDSADLFRWEGWSPLARQYIEASGESVDLETAVRTYTDGVMAFDRWVAANFAQEHVDGVESYLHAESEYVALLRRLGLYGTPGLSTLTSARERCKPPRPASGCTWCRSSGSNSFEPSTWGPCASGRTSCAPASATTP